MFRSFWHPLLLDLSCPITHLHLWVTAPVTFLFVTIQHCFDSEPHGSFKFLGHLWELTIVAFVQNIDILLTLLHINFTFVQVPAWNFPFMQHCSNSMMHLSFFTLSIELNCQTFVLSEAVTPCRTLLKYTRAVLACLRGQ